MATRQTWTSDGKLVSVNGKKVAEAPAKSILPTAVVPAVKAASPVVPSAAPGYTLAPGSLVGRPTNFAGDDAAYLASKSTEAARAAANLAYNTGEGGRLTVLQNTGIDIGGLGSTSGAGAVAAGSLGSAGSLQMQALEKAQQEAEAARMASYKASAAEVQQSVSEASRQAYVNLMKAQKSVPSTMAAAGYSGGMTETTAAGLSGDYQRALTAMENQKAQTLARLQADRDAGIANDAAGYQSQMAGAISDIEKEQYQRKMDQISLVKAQEQEAYDRQLAQKQMAQSASNTAASRQTALSSTEYARALDKAETLAKYGDFSGYGALGFSTQEILAMKAGYQGGGPTKVPASYAEAFDAVSSDGDMAPLMAYYRSLGYSEDAIARLINESISDSESAFYGMRVR